MVVFVSQRKVMLTMLLAVISIGVDDERNQWSIIPWMPPLRFPAGCSGRMASSFGLHIRSLAVGIYPMFGIYSAEWWNGRWLRILQAYSFRLQLPEACQSSACWVTSLDCESISTETDGAIRSRLLCCRLIKMCIESKLLKKYKKHSRKHA